MNLIHSPNITNCQNPSTAYDHANRILIAKGRSFHWARRLLGSVHANRATRLYGFCRWIDDLADEAVSTDTAKEALNMASTDIQRGKSNSPILIDALRLIEECKIDPAIALELIQGVRSDLDPVRIETQTELLRYCYKVAGTVGLMMSAALDVVDEAALPHAIDLGIAMQLTNICRDVREDALNNRRYLPAEIVGHLDPEQLVDPTFKLKSKICAGITTLLDLANIYYESGEDGLAYLPARARSGILIAGRVYGGIGVKLRKQNCNYWTRRTVVSTFEKTKISTIAISQILWMRRFWSPSQRHDAKLHITLAGLPKVNLAALMDVKKT